MERNPKESNPQLAKRAAAATHAVDAGWRAENFSTMHIRESDKRAATGLDKFPAGYSRPRSRERPGPFVVFTLFQANTVLSEINSKLDACLSCIYFLVERPRRRV